MMSFPKTSRAGVPEFYSQILVNELIFFKSLRIPRNDIFVTARRFYLDHFHIFAHSFRKHYKIVSMEWWGVKEVYVTLPSQIYSSYLRDYIANSVRNIKAFPNAIRNLVVSLL